MARTGSNNPPNVIDMAAVKARKKKPAAQGKKPPEPKYKRVTPQRHRLFLTEWMQHLDYDDAKLAVEMGVADNTVYRWRTRWTRFDPEKQEDVANVLKIHPSDFWRPPGQVSVDTILRDASPSTREAVADLASKLTEKDRSPKD